MLIYIYKLLLLCSRNFHSLKNTFVPANHWTRFAVNRSPKIDHGKTNIGWRGPSRAIRAWGDINSGVCLSIFPRRDVVQRRGDIPNHHSKRSSQFIFHALAMIWTCKLSATTNYSDDCVSASRDNFLLSQFQFLEAQQGQTVLLLKFVCWTGWWEKSSSPLKRDMLSARSAHSHRICLPFFKRESFILSLLFFNIRKCANNFSTFSIRLWRFRIKLYSKREDQWFDPFCLAPS